MSAGSIRNVNVDGIPYNAAADANFAFNPRIEKEPIPHSGGNMIKRTIVGAMAEAVKLTLTPSEYNILRSQSDAQGIIPMSAVMADGSSLKSQGEINLGQYMTDDSSCEIQMLTSTGIWEIFSAS